MSGAPLPPTAPYDWGDLRPFLAVARGGSTLPAAKAIGASQSTVTRRLAALEAALGLKLFERTQAGSRLTDQGRVLLALAEKAEAAAAAFGEAARMARRTLSGTIRFTMPPEGADAILAQPLTAFMQRHPEVRVEVLATDAFLDIAAGEADVAIRAGRRPTDERLVARKLSEVTWRGFASPAYLARRGTPAGWDDLAGHALIGAEGQVANSPALVWLAARTAEFVVRASSLRGMAGFARAGAGIALLPGIEGMGDAELVPCLPPVEEAKAEIWLVTRQDVRHAPHVRAFIDFLTAHTTARLAPARLESARQERPAGPSVRP
jgi:DNA-binding transcriptional LysR family regulator